MVATERMNDIFEDDRQMQNKGKGCWTKATSRMPRRRPGCVTKPATGAGVMTKAADEQASPKEGK